jgi:hypothetical protein
LSGLPERIKKIMLGVRPVALLLPGLGLDVVRTGKEIRFRFWLSEDKAGKEAKCRPTGW